LTSRCTRPRSWGERPFLGEQRLQVVAVDETHRDVQHAVGLARLVDRDHVRVVERGCELGLAQEPLPEPLVLGELRRQELEGDIALQARVMGAVDDAHATASDERLDPVAEELGADTLVCGGGHSLRPVNRTIVRSATDCDQT
jgi:hypothetical protein